MAQAQFIGRTPAENSQAASDSFMQGMNALSQFGQFATEQNRLNKIEEIKNKTNWLLLNAQREGGGPGMEWLGLKALATGQEGMLRDYLTMIHTSDPASKKAFKPEMLDEEIRSLQSSEVTSPEKLKYFVESIQKFAGGEPVPQVLPPAAVKAPETQEPTGGLPTATSGYPQNLSEWDQLQGEAQAAQNGIMSYAGEKGYYKPILEKLGIAGEDQGVPGEPRMMYFSPGIAKQILDKLDAEEAASAASGSSTPVNAGSPTPENFYEFLAANPDLVKANKMVPVATKEAFDKMPAEKQAAYLKNLTASTGITYAGKSDLGKKYFKWLETQGSSAAAPAQTFKPFTGSLLQTGRQEGPLGAPSSAAAEADAGKAARDELRAKVQSDLSYHTNAMKMIDDVRKRVTAGKSQFSGFSSEEQATAATHGNMQREPEKWVTDKGTVGYPSGTVPAASAEQALASGPSAPQVPPQASLPSAQASQELVQQIPEITTDKDARLAQSYSAKLRTANSKEAFLALAQKNPEEALASARWQAQDDAYQTALAMYLDPKGEIEYQRDKKSGALQANIDLISSNAKLALKQVELLPQALEAEKLSYKARMAEAEASMANSKNSVTMSKLAVDGAQLDLERARLMNAAAQSDATYGPVKDQTKSYNDAVQQYVNYCRTTVDKDGNLPATAAVVATMNLLIDNVNNQVGALNAAGMAAFPGTWASWTSWPGVTLSNRNGWQKFWNTGWDKMKIIPEGEATPATGGKAVPATSVPAANAGDDYLRSIGIEP